MGHKNFLFHGCIFLIMIILIINSIPIVNSINNNANNRGFKPTGWSYDYRITYQNQDYWCSFPHIASCNNYVHTIWSENLNSEGIPGKGLCYRRSSDEGNTWDNIMYLNNENDSISNNIAASGSNVHIIFTSSNISGIQYRRSLDNGSTWGPIQNNLTEISGTNLNIDVYNDIVHIVWQYTWEEVWGIIYLRSLDNGNTWNQHQWLIKGTGSTNYLRPRLTVYENNIYISYWGVNDTIELLRSFDNGNTWDQKQIFSGPNVAFPEIACERDLIGIAWINTSDLDHPYIQFTKSSNRGEIWTNPMMINDQHDYLWIYSSFSMKLENNIFHLAWADNRDWPNESNSVFNEIYYKKSVDGGISWTNDIRLTKKNPNGPSSWEPSLSVSNNSVYVVWPDDREDRMQIFFKRTLPDFTIVNFILPSESWANVTINLELYLTNIGYADGHNIPIKIEASNQILFEENIERINQGEIIHISIPWKPTKSGAYNLKVVIDADYRLNEWNEDNNIINESIKINKNKAPIANLNINASRVKTLQEIKFDASKSYDPDGNIEYYYFDFGNGNNSNWIESSSISYFYINDGIYNSKLKVIDDVGAESDWVITQIFIDNREPIAKIVINKTTIIINNTIEFKGSNSIDLDGKIISYNWDFGDGSNSTDINPNHNYKRHGNFIVELIVIDDDEAINYTQINLTVIQLDSDFDGYPDEKDQFPNNSSEWIDSDNDQIGNNADLDDDNDGLSDIEETAMGTDSLLADTDGDGFNDNDDEYPLDSTKWEKENGDQNGEEPDEKDATIMYAGFGIIVIIIIVIVILIFYFSKRKK